MHPGGTAGSSRPAGPNSRLDIRKGALQTLIRFAPGSGKMTGWWMSRGAAEHCVQRARGVDVPSRAFHGPTCTATHQPPDPGQGSSLLAERSTRTRQQHSSLVMGRWDGKLGRAHGLVPAPSEEGSVPITQAGSGRTDSSRGAVPVRSRLPRRRMELWQPGGLRPEVVAICADDSHGAPRHAGPSQPPGGHTESATVAERRSERALCRRRCADYCVPSYVWCSDGCTRTDGDRVVG